MRTTVALTPATRDRLVRLKRQWGAKSLEDVIVRVLDGAPLGARALVEGSRDDVEGICRRHGILRLVAIGSRARGDARPDSDLDLVATFRPDASLLDLAHAQEALSQVLGVRVDLLSEGGMDDRMRRRVQEEGQVLVGS